MRLGLVSLCVGLVMATPDVALAQVQTATRTGLCWRGRPQARCAGFLVSEFSLVVGPTRPSRRPPSNGIWELGAMRNITSSYAAGATAFVLHDDEHRYLLGVRPRVRYWVNEDVSVDVGLGIIVHDLKKETFVVKTPSLTGRAGVTWTDRVGIFAQLEVLSVQGSPQANPALVGTQTTL